MKLRIQGDSLRLRLKKAEVARFAEEGHAEDCIRFGDAALCYRVEMAQVDAAQAELDDRVIRVLLPETLARHWATSEQVSMENVQTSPTILVEKDFKCLHDETRDESDSFPNPMSTSSAKEQ